MANSLNENYFFNDQFDHEDHICDVCDPNDITDQELNNLFFSAFPEEARIPQRSLAIARTVNEDVV